MEAIGHFTKGLGLLNALPDTAERSQQELALQLALGNSLMATKGYAAPEVEEAYSRALELCRQMGEPPQLFSVLVGLWRLYFTRAEHKTAHELGEQCLSLAQREHNPVRLLGGHQSLGISFFRLGAFTQARAHLEQALTLYDPQKHRSHVFRGGQDPAVACLCHLAWVLWSLGYPDQALRRSHEALTLAQELSHPLSLAQALVSILRIHQHYREGQAAQERAEALMTLSSDQGFAYTLAWGAIMRGWAVAEQGRWEEGLVQMRQGMTAMQATGAQVHQPCWLALLAEEYEQMGQTESGLNALAEALAVVDKTDEREYESELYRLKGGLTLQQENQKSKGKEQKSKIPDTQHLAPKRRQKPKRAF